jgi:hypothetical protein
MGAEWTARGTRKHHLTEDSSTLCAHARQAKLRVFYVPHRRYRPGDYETWKYIAPIQKAAWT